MTDQEREALIAGALPSSKLLASPAHPGHVFFYVDRSPEGLVLPVPVVVSIPLTGLMQFAAQILMQAYPIPSPSPLVT